MDTKKRRELLKDLQLYGVTEYAEGDIRIKLGAAPLSPALPLEQTAGEGEVDDDGEMGDPRLLLEKLAKANGKVSQ